MTSFFHLWVWTNILLVMCYCRFVVFGCLGILLYTYSMSFSTKTQLLITAALFCCIISYFHFLLTGLAINFAFRSTFYVQLRFALSITLLASFYKWGGHSAYWYKPSRSLQVMCCWVLHNISCHVSLFFSFLLGCSCWAYFCGLHAWPIVADGLRSF